MSARFVRLVSVPSSDPALRSVIELVATFDGVPPEMLLDEFQTRLRETYPDASVVSGGTTQADGADRLTWFVYRDADHLADGQHTDA